MKVKDVIEFLSKCNPNAEFVSEDRDGNNHALDELDSGACFHLDEESNMLMTINCVYAIFKEERFK